jgi:hypothetical protein
MQRVMGCDKYWALDPPVQQCVRGQLLAADQSLNATFRQLVKDTPYVDNYVYVSVFYNMHVQAYDTYCCYGEPAPMATWLAIFYAGAALPCATELAMILDFGRCGGGW